MTASPDPAAAALAAAPIADLLRTAYRLTHLIHVSDNFGKAQHRAARDLIDAEVERRTSPAVVSRPLSVVPAPVEDWCDECGCPRAVTEEHPETVGDGAEARRVIVAELACGHSIEYRREAAL